MNFQPTEDQIALAEGVRALCEGRFPLERIRAREGAETVVDPDGWRELGEAGVFSLTLPEDQGGVGLGLADAAVVFEELGRALVPGPLVGTFVAAGLVPGAAQGLAQVGVSVRSDPHPAGTMRMPTLIEHLGSLDGLIVVSGPPDDGLPAGKPDPAVLVDVEKVRGTATRVARTLDPLTPLWRVEDPLPGADLEASSVDGTGAEGSGERLRQRGLIVSAALQVGVAARCVELATEYAKQRQQFGRPIGGFQAIKHLCADMLVRSETARCAVHAAAALADQPEAAEFEAESSGTSPGEVLLGSASGAKLLADEAAIANARGCIQVHGGMGFTWEVPVHLYLKRARVLATSLGTPAQLAETVATLV